MNKNPEIIYLLNSVPSRCLQAVERFYQDNNLDRTKTFLMSEIYRQGGRCGFNQIIQSSLYTAGTISKQFSQLVKKGYVVCFVDDRGQNNKSVELTEKGLAYAERALELYAEVEKIGTRTFSEAQKQEYTNMLHQVYMRLCPSFNVELRVPDTYPFILYYYALIIRAIEYDSVQNRKMNDLKEPERKILLALAYEKKACKYKKLERMTVLTQPYIVKSMKRLEKKGLVVTQTDAKDKRVKFASLVDDAGVLRAEFLMQKVQEMQNEICKNMTEEQIEHFHHYLITFDHALGIEFG